MLKYLKGCPSLCIFYSTSLKFQLLAFSDAEIGEHVQILANLSHASMFSLEMAFSLGSARNKQNTEPWLPLLENWFGSLISFVILVYIIHYLYLYTVTTMLPSRLLKIPYSINARNTLTLTVMWFESALLLDS